MKPAVKTHGKCKKIKTWASKLFTEVCFCFTKLWHPGGTGERTTRARPFCVCSTWTTCWRIAPNPRWVHSNYGKAACAPINCGSQLGQSDSLLFTEPPSLADQESLEPYTKWSSWYRLLLSKTFQNKVPARVNVIYFPPWHGQTFFIKA